MGCSRELISLVSQISCLTVTRLHDDPASTRSNEAAGLMKQLSFLRQDLPIGLEHSEIMVKIAELKRLTAMLYLHDRVVVTQPGNSLVFAQNLRNTIIKAIEQLPVGIGALLWLLFVLGTSNLSSHKQAQFALNRLHQLEKSRYLGSFYHARRRVERSIHRRILLHGGGLQGIPEEDTTLSDNERWVSVA